MYEYRVFLDRVVDGDTVDVHIDLGFDVRLIGQRIRLFGLDTWESRTRDLEVKAKGLLAKDFTKQMCVNAEQIILISHERGKYGRILGVAGLGCFCGVTSWLAAIRRRRVAPFH